MKDKRLSFEKQFCLSSNLSSKEKFRMNQRENEIWESSNYIICVNCLSVVWFMTLKMWECKNIEVLFQRVVSETLADQRLSL